MKSGKLTPLIDKRYRLNEVSEAIRYFEGHAPGKVVITLQSVTPPDHARCIRHCAPGFAISRFGSLRKASDRPLCFLP
jgi:hypothetical protein